MNTAIWWIRRDLRINDNDALIAALREGWRVIPVFILDRRLFQFSAIHRQAFLTAGLRVLSEDLQRRGSRLTIREGDPLLVLTQLLVEAGAEAIFAEEDYSPFARARDESIAGTLPLRLVTGLTVFHPAMVHKADGLPYTVFTPFSKVWKSLPFPGATDFQIPERLPEAPPLLSDPLPDMPGTMLFSPGETEARTRLDAFLSDAVFRYHEDRNRMDLDGTSTLSPYLRFGMISARRASAEVRRMMANAPDHASLKGAETWLNELIWREFYHSILYHFPMVLKSAFNPALRDIAWWNSDADFQAWKDGLTGYPVIDAAMRQLAQSGWMHNRARMITASFLVKDLLIDWQKGERWFFSQLVDGDPAANNGGWQWTAGVGTDAAPYFRVFNPTLQGAKFDPQGAYVRRWVKELEAVPDAYIHEPWKMPEAAQRQFHCRIGVDYPAPVVDHKAARERVLSAFKRAKANSA